VHENTDVSESTSGGGVCRAKRNGKNVTSCVREKYGLLTDTLKGQVDA